MNKLKEMDEKALKRFGSKAGYQDRMIHAALVVHAAPDAVPEGLLAAFNDATQPDEQGKRCKYIITIYIQQSK